MKIAKILVLLVPFLISSCNKHDDRGTGAIRLNLAADATTITVGTKATEPSLTPEMFKIRVEDGNNKVLKTWNSFIDMPSPTRINAGSYRMVAWYGSEKLPAWDVPYYEGAVDFSIEKGESKDININCALAATKVQVEFDSSFDVYYSAYSVDVRTTKSESEFLNFDPTTQGRAAYFKPGKMHLKFRLTSKANGETLFFSPIIDVTTSAREFHKLYMSANVAQGIGTITITTDETTNDKSIEIIIPRN